jgi:hypothetical protein
MSLMDLQRCICVTAATNPMENPAIAHPGTNYWELFDLRALYNVGIAFWDYVPHKSAGWTAKYHDCWQVCSSKPTDYYCRFEILPRSGHMV